MPIASVAPAATMPTVFTRASSARGMNSITNTPSIGRKTPTLRSQF